MSSTVLRLIPADPFYVPDSTRQTAAVARLEEMLPDGEDCEAEVYETVQFIDNGENTESVECPACHRHLNVAPSTADSDHAEWFASLVEATEEEDVLTLETVMPCCGTTARFTDFTFDWPAGFARFELSIWNPNIERPFREASQRQLEELLQCKLEQIWAHY